VKTLKSSSRPSKRFRSMGALQHAQDFSGAALAGIGIF
jgi:hypothetical protein